MNDPKELTLVDQHLLLDRAEIDMKRCGALSAENIVHLTVLRERIWKEMTSEEASELDRRHAELLELSAAGGAGAAAKAREEEIQKEKELIGTLWKVRSRYTISMTVLEAGGDRRDQTSIKSRIDLVLIERPATSLYWGLWLINETTMSGTILLQGPVDASKTAVERRAQALNDAGEALRDLGSRLWTIGLETP